MWLWESNDLYFDELLQGHGFVGLMRSFVLL